MASRSIVETSEGAVKVTKPVETRDSPSGTSRCIRNAFYSSPSECKVQEFCASPNEVTVGWLSDALNAEVLSFTPKVCAQGQLGVTVVVQDIKYAMGTTGRPSGVAIKMHTQTPGMVAFARMVNAYSKELFFYTSLAEETPLRSPKIFGMWTDANGEDLANCDPVEGYNLMMENLSEDWDEFDTVRNIPSVPEFQSIILAAQAMHVKYWKNPVIIQRPISAGDGFECRFYEEMAIMTPEFWPPVRDAMPALAGWGSEWPSKFGALVRFIDRFAADLEKHKRLVGVMSSILNSRPLTLIHGDLNAGNVWKNKTTPNDFTAIDWQLIKMAPVGLEFGNMLIVLPKGPSAEDLTTMMRAYHDKLPSAARAEYTLSQLRDDFRCHVVFLTLGLSVVQVGQLEPSSMDAAKYEFTWKSYWPSMFERFLQLFDDEGIEDFVRGLLAGEYSNYTN